MEDVRLDDASFGIDEPEVGHPVTGRQKAPRRAVGDSGRGREDFDHHGRRSFDAAPLQRGEPPAIEIDEVGLDDASRLLVPIEDPEEPEEIDGGGAEA